MPDRANTGRFRALGRLLPREVRERIYEPALADLTRRWLTDVRSRGAIPFGARALATWIACLPIVIPRTFVRERRLTRLGTIVVWGSAIVVLVVFLLVNLSHEYATYTAR